MVVAPLANHSGASAAVGTVYEREAVSYRAVDVPGADGIRAYGVDASPALSVIIGCQGAFGPRPDVVVSGINLGVNVGRSVLHSGTVGAALTAAQLGVRGLAVSLRSGYPPEPWETAARVAVGILPVIAGAPAGTVLNLNVPSVPLDRLRGVRRARISTSGLVRSAGNARLAGGGPASGGDPEEGEIRLVLGAAVPSLGDVTGEDPRDDAALVAAGYAALTPLAGVREAIGDEVDWILQQALDAARAAVRT